VGVLCALQGKNELPPTIKFDFAVLISGFEPLDSRYSNLYSPETKIGKVRSLHVIGRR